MTMQVERITYRDEWLDNVIQQGKFVLEQLAKETFERYREMGKLILESGFRKGQWHSEHRLKALQEWCVSERTFQRWIKLGEMSEEEFRRITSEFWGHKKKIPQNNSSMLDIQLYNVWKTFVLNETYGEDYPGRTPHQILVNLLYYYTNEGDLVVDPMAGGGTTIDVCRDMKRRCKAFDIVPVREDIKPHDILKELPLRNIDFIFLDPPYYNAKEGYVSNEFTQSIESFYFAMERAIENCKEALKSKGILAIMLKPLGSHEKNGFSWYDLTLEIHKIACSKGLKIVKRICVPLSTQQYDGLDVSRAKEHRYMLNTLRDVVVYQK